MSDTGNPPHPSSPAPDAALGLAAGEAAQSAVADPIENRFTFDGENTHLWPMTMRIAILNLITLFFYRFWGRTKVRQYLWARTSFLGDRLTYTGSGKEMFLGFLIIFALVLLPIFLASLYVVFYWSEGAQVGFFVGLAIVSYFLFYVATYRALRYRLSRTNWRGIRGTQSGSSLVYALKVFGWFLAMPFTLGLLYTRQSVSLTGMKLNNAWFGDRNLVFESAGKVGMLWNPYIRAWLGYIFKPAAIMAPFNILSASVISASEKTGQGMNEDMLTAFMAIGSLLVYLGVLRTYTRYKARELTIMADWVHFGDLRFHFDADHNQMFRLVFGNMLITFLTLGFGKPFAQIRKVRFICDHVTVLGEPDLDALGQSKDKGPGMGEGLADAFDAGSI